VKAKLNTTKNESTANIFIEINYDCKNINMQGKL